MDEILAAPDGEKIMKRTDRGHVSVPLPVYLRIKAEAESTGKTMSQIVEDLVWRHARLELPTQPVDPAAPQG